MIRIHSNPKPGRAAPGGRLARCLAGALALSAGLIHAAPQSLTTRVSDGQVEILVEGKLFTVYRHDSALKKPYLWPVIGPRSGKSVTVESVAKQYPHHNSIWFGCDRVNGQNFWQPHGQIENGQIRSEAIRLVASAGERVVIEDTCIWQKPGAAPVIRDVRRIGVSAPSADVRLIDFEITLTMLVDVVIQKTNHSLFSVRMMPELSAKGSGTLVNAEGLSGEKGTFGKPSDWCDVSGVRDGVVEGVALFQHPSNPGYPAKWFTRDYGFMSPTPMYWPEEGNAHRYAKGDTLTLRYRVAVHGGTPPGAGIPMLYREFARQQAGAPTFSTEDLAALRTHEPGGSRELLYRLESVVRRAPPTAYRTLEDAYIALLEEGETTAAARRYICRQLGAWGSNACVPALAALVLDARAGAGARLALTQVGSDEAVTALTGALPRAAGPVRLELIGQLGDLRAAARPEVLNALRPSLTGDDDDLKAAALDALAVTGEPAALQAIESVEAGGAPATAKGHALVRWAVASRDREASRRVLVRLVSGPPYAAAPVRAAAAVELVRRTGVGALPLVEELLASQDRILRGAASQCLIDLLKTGGASGPVAALLETGHPEWRVPILQALAEHGDSAAAPKVRSLLADEDGAVRGAAWAALARLGTPDDVPVLVAALDRAEEEAGAAQNTLIKLSGNGVHQALVAALSTLAQPAGRLRWVETVRARGQTVTGDAILKLVSDEDRKVRTEALKCLGELGTAADIEPLIAHLGGDLPSDADRAHVEACLAALAARTAGGRVPSAVFLDALAASPAPTRASLCAILGTLADEAALGVLATQAADEEPAVSAAAVRALSSWPRPSALPVLMEIATSTPALTQNVLALRGVRRLLMLARDSHSDDELDVLLEQAKGAARRDEERALFNIDFAGVRLKAFTVASKGGYKVHRGGMEPGASWATDRNYTFTEVPAAILNATCVEVTMEDRAVKPGPPFMSFEVDGPVVVYVCYDHRCRKLPDWLASWEKTDEWLRNSASRSDQILYRKAFPAGRIVLGGCAAPGVAAMYTVCVVPGG